MSTKLQNIDQYSINVARSLIMDTVRNADSGHTGGPLSSLDFTYILFKEFLKFDPNDPDWDNRDRFVLSVGHESALIYTMLYYTILLWGLFPRKHAAIHVIEHVFSQIFTKINL